MDSTSFLRTNSTILETYFLSRRSIMSKTKLPFPNCAVESKKIARKCFQKSYSQQIHKKHDKIKFQTVNNDSLTRCQANLYSSNIKKDKEQEMHSSDYENIHSPVEIKYSWHDLENWIPPSAKKKIAEKFSLTNKKLDENNFECKIKYSWQIIGVSTQTSKTLLNITKSDALINQCSIKYSWQIIGRSTQTSLHDKSQFIDDNYWIGRILTPNNTSDSANNKNNNKKCMVYNEYIQTSAEKALQTELTDCRVKYSWQNLTKPYLYSSTCT